MPLPPGTLTPNLEHGVDNRFRAVFDAVPNPMIIVNREGFITRVNHQAGKLFGYSQSGLRGKPLEILVREPMRQGHLQLIDGFFKNPQARFIGIGRDLYGVTRSGREIPIEIDLNRLLKKEQASRLITCVIW